MSDTAENASSDDTIRIFISSPGDVAQERVIAERVVERLQGEFARRATLDVIRWEREPLRATEHFQEQITPPAETDISIFILWSRLGTPLPEDKFQKESGEQYRSGTEWEFENAVEAYQEKGTPDLVTYRKTKDPEARLSDEEDVEQRLEQKRALESFVEQWFKDEEGESFQAAFHAFASPAEFEQMLETHLRKLIEEHLPERTTEGAKVTPDAHWHQGSPFRGLRPFEEEHAPIFFGRTEAVTRIIERLERQAEDDRPFVLVHGPSGTGKSSVVKAGVVPTLTRPGVIEGIGHWGQATLRPSDAPEDLTGGLAGALFRAVSALEETGFTEEELAGLLRETPEQAASPLRAGLRNAAKAIAEEEGVPEPPTTRVLLTIDQLEEIFTLGSVDAEGRAAFAEAVRALTESGLVWTVASIRSDFFPRLSEVEALRDLKQGEGNYDLDPPSFAELGRMIRGPVRAAGLRFEEDPDRGIGLGEVLHEAAAEAPEALPLLEFTLEELYRRRTEEDVLTFEAYEELGGLTGAIAERAESVFSDLDPSVQAAFDDVMGELVTIEPGGEEAATSRRAAMVEVTDTPEKEALTDALVEARLLVTGQTDAGEAVVNVAHEALLREWPRLTDWIERNRAFLQTRARVQERAARWDEENRPEDLLLPTGQPLAEARGLVEERAEALGETLRTYIERSIERAERRERRRRYVVGGVAAVFFLVVAGFGIFSYQQWTESAERRDEALRSQSLNLAEDARAQVGNGDAMTGMLLALEALPKDMSNPERPYVPKAQSALYHALVHNRERWFVNAHSRPITDADLGPKGRYLVTASKDSTARIYDLDRREMVSILQGHGAPVTLVEFDSSASRVLTAGGRMVRVLQMPTGEPVRDFAYEGSVEEVCFSPDGERVVTATSSRGEKSDSLEISIGDVSSGRWQTLRVGRNGRLHDLIFSPGGGFVAATIVSGGEPEISTVHVWDKNLDNHSSRVLRGPEIQYATFLPQREQLMITTTTSYAAPTVVRFLTVPGLKTVSTVSKGGGGYASVVNRAGEIAASETARSEFVLFDPKSGAERGRVEYSGQFLESASFGPKERYLVLQSSGGGGSIQLVDAVKGREQAVFRSRVVNPVLAEVRPEKRRVVAVGRGGVQVWSTELRPGVKTVQGNTKRFAIGPTGDFVARADSLGGIRLIGLEKEITDRVLEGHSDRVSELAFGPEGKWLASASRDRTVRVWKTKTGKEQGVFRHVGPVEQVSFAQNGTRIVSGYNASEREEGRRRSAVVLWDRSTQKKVATLDSIAQFHVTPDGSRILTEIETSSASEGEASLVRVRSAQTGNLQAEFGGEVKIDRLYGGEALSNRHVLGYRDSVLHILDIDQGQSIGQIRVGDIPRTGGLALGPDGKKVAVASPDTAKIEVFSLASQRRLFTLRYPKEEIRGQAESVHFIEFDPQGEYVSGLVTTAAGVSIPAVWQIPKNGKEAHLLGEFSPHKIGPFDVPSFSPSGRYVLAQGKEEIRVHEIRDEGGRTTAGQVMQLENQSREFIFPRSRFTPDEQQLVTLSKDGRLRIWPVYDSPQALIDSARAAVTRQLTDAQREQFNLATEK